ncbi:hypothetical protein M758_8G081800 [Ceratodon purpureus]|nr:hypothetical protein M758_8G081800 [Ceratodon purpureus]
MAVNPAILQHLLRHNSSSITTLNPTQPFPITTNSVSRLHTPPENHNQQNHPQPPPKLPKPKPKSKNSTSNQNSHTLSPPINRQTTKTQPSQKHSPPTTQLLNQTNPLLNPILQLIFQNSTSRKPFRQNATKNSKPKKSAPPIQKNTPLNSTSTHSPPRHQNRTSRHYKLNSNPPKNHLKSPKTTKNPLKQSKIMRLSQRDRAHHSGATRRETCT